MKKLLFLLLPFFAQAQTNTTPTPAGYWQQAVKYTMNIDMDVTTNRYRGTQKLDYTNNSPDTLKRVFYHLYFNAFQPGSMMDTRSRRQGTVVLRTDVQGNELTDWDPRVMDRIANLDSTEIGFQRIRSLKMNGVPQSFVYHETILEVPLSKPIPPKGKATFDMDWDAQVPLQIRRSGRDNPTTGVRYTMTQWYPKMAEYDREGWHPTPYIAREFYGVWGDFDVTINIDKSYVLGGTGYLQAPTGVGYGYEPKGSVVKRPAGNKLAWRFVAPTVHDFAFAADPGYKHITRQVDGIDIHVLYKGTPTRDQFEDQSEAVIRSFGSDYNKWAATWDAQWERIADAAVIVYPFIKKNFGAYPYKQYSFIHGGDGGMEYPMSTMLVSSSIGTAFHEWMHTWYQMMMATNEGQHAWMDEGFTEFATKLVAEYYRQQTQSSLPAEQRRRLDSAARAALPLYLAPNYGGYLALARSGKEEPLTTHSDHYNTNYAYSSGAYNKGAVFLEQLGYITGAAMRDSILLDYYRTWRFRHPTPQDFINVAERRSGLKLDWYKMYWIGTTKTIDYSIDSIWQQGAGTQIRLRRVGQMPMPLDVKLTFKDGTSEWHYVPLYHMFGAKPAEPGQTPRKVYESWRWTNELYTLQSGRSLGDLLTVEIDPSYRMADVERRKNKLDLSGSAFGR